MDLHHRSLGYEPSEILLLYSAKTLVPTARLELAHLSILASKTSASTNSARRAFGAGGRIRTDFISLEG